MLLQCFQRGKRVQNSNPPSRYSTMELLLLLFKQGNEVGLWVNGLGWIRQLLKSQTQTLIWVTLPATLYHFQVSELKLSSHLIFIAIHTV